MVPHVKKTLCLISILVLILLPTYGQRRMENLDRGLVAMKVTSGVFLSWRVLGPEFTNTGYNLYRDGSKIASFSVSDASNYSDLAGTLTSTYYIKAAVGGVEQTASPIVTVWPNIYKEIPLSRPSKGALGCSYEPNDCSTADLDGDGQYEIVVKWQPTNYQDNSIDGYTDPTYLDAYKLDGTFLWRISLGINIRSGAHYTQFMVYDLDGDGKAEVVCKTAPGTTDGIGAYLSGAAAGTDNSADYRNTTGRVLSGPEYLTVFNGQTGKELQTINYEPGRGTITEWGDDYGNRCDRFLACVAYLNGKTPSLVMCRGYYEKTVLVAYNWAGGALTKIWNFTADDTQNTAYIEQGCHTLSVADVDGDGYDEIIYGSCCIDHDGTGKYSTGLGHGDALHVSDLDPDRPGYEVWQAQEYGTTNGGIGASFRDANTGEIIFYDPYTSDNGRALCGNVLPTVKGVQCWSVASTNLFSCKGAIAGTAPVKNPAFICWWDSTIQRQNLTGSTCDNFVNGRAMTFYNYANATYTNGTKNTPNLQADILGDWREEEIYRSVDSTKLIVFSTTYPTSRRIYTLMHDKEYRLSVAWQNVGYNQPPWPSFYIGAGMSSIPPSANVGEDISWSGNNTTWDVNATQSWSSNGTSALFQQGNKVLFDQYGLSGTVVNTTANITGTPTPGMVSVVSSIDYTFAGSGTLAGTMQLVKNGSGKLTINNANTFTGTTTIWDGALLLNGTSTSPVIVNGGLWSGLSTKCATGARFGGTGTLNANLIVNSKGAITPGNGMGAAGTLNVSGNVVFNKSSYCGFDISNTPAGTNDLLSITGNFTITDTIGIYVNLLNGTPVAGDYPLITYTGTLTGNPLITTIAGLAGIPCTIYQSGKTIGIRILSTRASADIVWAGTSSNWDLGITSNWLNSSVADIFAVNDRVTFNNTGSTQSTVLLKSALPAESLVVSATNDYIFSGSGYISGTTGLTKSGTGKLTITNANTFTGSVSLTGGVTEVNSIGNKGLSGNLGTSSSISINGGTLRTTTAGINTNRDFVIGASGAIFDVSSTIGQLTIVGTISGTGALIKNGEGTLWLSASNTFSGGLTVNEGSLRLMNAVANSSGVGTSTLTLNGGSLIMSDVQGSETAAWGLSVPSGKTAALSVDGRSTLTGSLVGSGTINIYAPYTRTDFKGDWSAFTGKIYLTSDADGGDFRVYNSYGYANAAINLGALVSAYRSGGSGTISVGELSGVSTSVLTTGAWSLGALNTDAVFDGLISGTTSIAKVGSGSWTISKANTYTGGTTITGGTLIVSGTTETGTGVNTVSSTGTLMITGTTSGAIAVNSGGTLAGTGTSGGAVTIASGGTIAPGNGGIGTLKCSSSVTLQSGSTYKAEINSSSLTSDLLSVTGTLALSGTLNVSNLGSAYTAGTSFTLFSAASISGTFTTVTLPTLTNGLVWDISALYTSGKITLAKGSQSITFNVLNSVSFGIADFDLGATATSGLTPTYTSDNTNVATIVSGKIHIVGVGTAIITTAQVGNGYYNAASSVQQSLTVNKATQTITFGALSSKTYGDASFTLTATSSSGLSVTYSSDNTGVASISGTKVTIVGAGTANITASQAGNSNYAATSVVQQLTVNKANQSIEFADISDKDLSESGFTLSATASTALPITFSSSDPLVATISNNVVTLLKTGTTTITASQAGNANYNTQYVSKTLNVINKQNQVITFSFGTVTYGDTDFTIPMTVSTGLPLTFTSSNTAVATIVSGKIRIVGAGNTNITASQSGNATYLATSSTQTLIVSKAKLAVSVTDTFRLKGKQNPKFRIVYTGFVNNDSQSLLQTLPTASCAADSSSILGDYPIVVSGGNDANYDFVCTNGKLTVMFNTSTKSVTSPLTLMLYPNPVSGDKITVMIDDNIKPNSRIFITDLSGKTVPTQYLEQNSNTSNVNVSTLQAGLYILKIENIWGGYETLMFVKL